MNRRAFLKQASSVAALAAAGCASAPLPKAPFKVSLAEWSLHKQLFAKTIKHLDFPKIARQEFDIEAVELVNQFMKDQVKDAAYLAELKRRADDEGVRILLIMCDGEGELGDPDTAKRRQAVINHYKWADAAKALGGHSIRVNAATGGVGSFEEQQKRAAEGLSELADYCGKLGLNCVVENHGGLSSNGRWLAGVMRKVNKPNCGTLPDFGNFQTQPGEWYDRYVGVAEMMPFAKAVSAKSYDFDAKGNCIETDYHRMMQIVMGAGYYGHVGIEYEGDKLSEANGIRATKLLLDRIREGVV